MKKILVFIGGILIVIAFSFVLYISTTYTDPLSKEELPKSEDHAKKEAIKYFKENKNIDVIIDEVGIIGELGPKRIWLDGHILNNENKKIYVIVTFEETKIVAISEVKSQ